MKAMQGFKITSLLSKTHDWVQVTWVWVPVSCHSSQGNCGTLDKMSNHGEPGSHFCLWNGTKVLFPLGVMQTKSNGVRSVMINDQYLYYQRYLCDQRIWGSCDDSVLSGTGLASSKQHWTLGGPGSTAWGEELRSEMVGFITFQLYDWVAVIHLHRNCASHFEFWFFF